MADSEQDPATVGKLSDPRLVKMGAKIGSKGGGKNRGIDASS